jgi:hypothetical protein
MNPKCKDRRAIGDFHQGRKEQEGVAPEEFAIRLGTCAHEPNNSKWYLVMMGNGSGRSSFLASGGLSIGYMQSAHCEPLSLVEINAGRRVHAATYENDATALRE